MVVSTFLRDGKASPLIDNGCAGSISLFVDVHALINQKKRMMLRSIKNE